MAQQLSTLTDFPEVMCSVCSIYISSLTTGCIPASGAPSPLQTVWAYRREYMQHTDTCTRIDRRNHESVGVVRGEGVARILTKGRWRRCPPCPTSCAPTQKSEKDVKLI